MSASELLVPETFNETLTNANTEYSVTMTKNTKHFSVQCRTAFDVRMAFVTGKVATPTAPYSTIKSGQVYTSPEKVNWFFTDQTENAAVLYVASAQAAVVVEVVAWRYD